jgi:hypothetical protein
MASSALHVLSPDTQAILLLCARLSKGPDAPVEKPLSPSEYHRLARWLHERSLCPGDLLQPEWLVPISNEGG